MGKNLGYLCIQQILVPRKSYVLRPPLLVSRGEILQFKYPRISAANGEKMRNASGHQGENERQGEKGEQEHIQHFLHKTCN